MRLRSCCLAALAAAAHAAVAGAPEPGPAGALPLASLTTSNDMFGNGLGNADDFRTAAIGGHVRLDHVVLAVDGSMLTDRAASTRSDELLAIAGWAWGQQTPATGWQHSGFIGAGIRVDGDLFGQDVQNSVHDSIGADQVFLTYDGTTRVRAAVAGSAAAGWLGQAGLGLTGWWGMQLVVAGQSAVDGEVICEIGPRLALVGRQGALWVGPRLPRGPARRQHGSSDRRERGRLVDRKWHLRDPVWRGGRVLGLSGACRLQPIEPFRLGRGRRGGAPARFAGRR